ncbi:tyrosine-type recombinase/integrase [Nitrospira defluvii]|nr:tyrosine-type recombinase/integrase [Nitrospira defluvii]
MPGIKKRSVQRAFERLLIKAGLKGSIHTLRHTAVTHLLMTGATLREVQQILGQQSIKTTSRYLHALESDMREATDRLEW